jgi:hypothetical protein
MLSLIERNQRQLGLRLYPGLANPQSGRYGLDAGRKSSECSMPQAI